MPSISERKLFTVSIKMLINKHLDRNAESSNFMLMRTTVTLETDVARRLQGLARERKISFKAALNETLRRGLEQARTKSKGSPFRTEPEDMGVFGHLNYDNIGDLLELAERTK
jgi:hypothetical protein